jgi:hypothetical protein
MKLGATEKNRLEEKQRAIRKYTEGTKQEHKPVYFEEVENPFDGNKKYWRYNGTYFEKDRKEQKWERCPDIFGETMPAEVEEYLASKK